MNDLNVDDDDTGNGEVMVTFSLDVLNSKLNIEHMDITKSIVSWQGGRWTCTLGYSHVQTPNTRI